MITRKRRNGARIQDERTAAWERQSAARKRIGIDPGTLALKPAKALAKLLVFLVPAFQRTGVLYPELTAGTNGMTKGRDARQPKKSPHRRRFTRGENRLVG